MLCMCVSVDVCVGIDINALVISLLVIHFIHKRDNLILWFKFPNMAIGCLLELAEEHWEIPIMEFFL